MFPRSIPLTLLALILLTWLVGSAKVVAAPPAGYFLVWYDEFDGTAMDTNKWSHRAGGVRRGGYNTNFTVSVGGGQLTINTVTSNGVHYTGMISTAGKFLPRYGYFEAGLDFNSTSGMWSAFWLQSPWIGQLIGNASDSGTEIDICEQRATDGVSDISGAVQSAIHWDGYGNDHKQDNLGFCGTNLQNGFHSYGCLWTGSSYTFSVDGSSCGSTTYGHSDRSEYIILSSEVEENGIWSGSVPPGGYVLGNTQLIVDYVRWYAPTSQMFWTGVGSDRWTNPASWLASSLRVPGPTDEVVFSSLAGTNTACQLGADVAVGQLTFLDGPPCEISGHTLTVGSGGLDASAADGSVNLLTAVNLATNQPWRVGARRTLTVSGPVSGLVTLTKTGLGVLLVNGVLEVPSLTVTGGILGGTGLLRAPVVVAAGGTLAPGGGLGTLTLSNTLSLAGTTWMELNRATGTNDRVRGLTSVNYGGTLTLTNLGGALTNGDTFTLFQSAAYAGAFQAIKPATPGVGLGWDTSRLTVDGSLKVVTLPVLNYSFSNGGLNFTWTGAAKLQSCPVLGAGGTNSSLWQDYPGGGASPVWVPVSTASGAALFRLERSP